MNDKVELTIPAPPEFLFDKAKQPVNEKQPIYLIEKMLAIENTGMCIYYKNVPYPKKGFPTPEALTAVNGIKKIVLESAKLLKNPIILLGVVLMNKTKLLKTFNTVYDKIAGQYNLKETFLCRSAFYLATFIQNVLTECGVEPSVAKSFGFNIAHLLEYDDAYRYRFQDLMCEIQVEAFKKNPRHELKRLYTIFKERTTDNVADYKIKYIVDAVSLLAWFIRKPLANNAEMLKLCGRDQADWYWSCLRADHYLYNGMSKEECHKQFPERPISYTPVD